MNRKLALAKHCPSPRPTWLVVFVCALLNLALAPAYACNAPDGHFCVDFFRGTELQGLPQTLSKAPYIKYAWANRSPTRGIPYDNFSARWRGRFEFAEGEYEFRLLADDGARILLDGQIVLDHWDDAQGLEHRAQITPGAGTHLVEVEYFEALGTAKLEADWKVISSASSTDSVAHTSVATNKDKAEKEPATLKQSLPAIAPLKASAFKPEAISRNNNKPALGINLSLFAYYSSSVPFKDLMMQNGEMGVYQKGSKERCRQPVSFDVDGYPRGVPTDCVLRIWLAFHIHGDDFWPKDVPAYLPGRYALTYQGKGRVELGWDAKNVTAKGVGRIEFDVPSPNAGIQIEATQIDAANPLRDMHVIHISDEATYQQQPFNERWLDILKPFSVLRFKDWGRLDENISVYNGKAISHTSTRITLPSNAPSEDAAFNDHMVALVNADDKWPRVFVERYDGKSRTLFLKTPIETSKSGAQPTVTVYDFANMAWAKRAIPTTLGQTSSKGLAFETMLQLANILDADPWITVPTAADDDFVEKLASLIKSRLKPGLKCYVEYSNETWNFDYPGYHYSEAKVKQLGLTGTVVPADAWHPYRAVEIFKIFNRVFGEADFREARPQSRLVRVLTSQTAWFDRAKAVMDWQMPGKAWPTEGQPAHRYADAWASTAYFGIKGNKTLEQASMDELIDMQIEDINSMFGSASQPGILRKLLAEAQKRRLQFITYEAGAGMLAPPGRQDLVAKAARSNLDPNMRQVYATMLDHWSALYREYGADSVGVWTQYYDVGRYASYGYWGLLQSTYQDPMTVPKFRAFIDYVSQP